MEMTTLEESIQNYESQLQLVQDSISSIESAEERSSLLELQNNLREVLKLTKDQLLDLKKEELRCKVNDMYSLDNSNDTDLENTENSEQNLKCCNDEIVELMNSLEGKKCRVPYISEWGQLSHQNAMIISAYSDNDDGKENIRALVLFMNPTVNRMKPCEFFLQDKCKFSSDCKFSHGYEVSFDDIKEYEEIYYGSLQRDAKCLVKYEDGLWYSAVVDKVLKNNKLKITYSDFDESATIDIADTIPIRETTGVNSDLESLDEENFDDANYDYLGNPLESLNNEDNISNPGKIIWSPEPSETLGQWEKHTKGIGMKLMLKMGYVHGQGLGKKGEGRIDPVEAVIVPSGISLDTFMKLKECNESGDTYMKRKILKRKKKRKSNRNKVDNSNAESMFKFLNNTLSKETKDVCPIKKRAESLKITNTKDLNIMSMKTVDEYREICKDIAKLEQSLTRNSDNATVTSQVQGKITDKKQKLLAIKDLQKKITSEQNSRSAHKKLTVF